MSAPPPYPPLPPPPSPGGGSFGVGAGVSPPQGNLVEMLNPLWHDMCYMKWQSGDIEGGHASLVVRVVDGLDCKEQVWPRLEWHGPK